MKGLTRLHCALRWGLALLLYYVLIMTVIGMVLSYFEELLS